MRKLGFGAIALIATLIAPLQAVDLSESPDRWINCYEGVPSDRPVLIYFHGFVVEAHYSIRNANWMMWDGREATIWEVEYWRPRPADPCPYWVVAP